MDAKALAFRADAIDPRTTHWPGLEMNGIGRARSYGAVSILNAFATGKGGALSIELSTTATVKFHNKSREISGFSITHPSESTKLVVTVVENILEHYGYRDKLGGEVIISSNIPPAVGLKSSSAAANATALATVSALDQAPDDEVLLNIVIDSSIETGVSLTGAFDDSFASYHGGAVLTDNKERRVEKKIDILPELRGVILVPPRKTYTGGIDGSKFAAINGLEKIAFREAYEKHPWDAMTLNGLACASVLGEDPQPALEALRAGALGAGISGKGPAVAAIVPRNKVDDVRRAWERYPGQVILSSPNSKKSEIEE